MARQGAADHGRGRREARAGEGAAAPESGEPLAQEIEEIEEQIAVLEDGLPGAPGAQRAALAKEINQYRGRLDEMRDALRRRRAAGPTG